MNKRFNILYPRYLEFIWRKLGNNGLVDGYIFNLNQVLYEVSGLIEYLSGRIIITSDHGELLGEDRLYGHGHPLPARKELIEVPWIILEKKGRYSIRKRMYKKSYEEDITKNVIKKISKSRGF